MTTSAGTLDGKLAVVTGASGGIGGAIARRLAHDGAYVMLHYGTSAAAAHAVLRDIRDAGGKGEMVHADLSTLDGAAVITQELGALGVSTVDILVNNAAIAPFATLLETTQHQFDTLLNVNIRAVFELTSVLLPLMPAGSRIINIGSIATRTAFPSVIAYAATKGWVEVFTRHLAQELGPRKITANVVSPGAIDTPMSSWIREEGGIEAVNSMQALEGAGEPRFVADAVAFLASPAAEWITGNSLDVSGGTRL